MTEQNEKTLAELMAEEFELQTVIDTAYLRSKDVEEPEVTKRTVKTEVMCDDKKSTHNYEEFDAMDYALKHKPETLTYKITTTTVEEGSILPIKDGE